MTQHTQPRASGVVRLWRTALPDAELWMETRPYNDLLVLLRRRQSLPPFLLSPQRLLLVTDTKSFEKPLEQRLR